MQRLDKGRTHGWQGKTTRKYKTRTKFFADLKYGGNDKAKELADKWEYLQRKNPIKCKFKPRSNTGVLGIHVNWRRNKKYLYHVMHMSYSVNGKRKGIERTIGGKRNYTKTLRELKALRKRLHRPL